VMLIPISGDNNLDSVDLLLDKYNIDIFPTILINEEFKIHNINELEEIEKYFK